MDELLMHEPVDTSKPLKAGEIILTSKPFAFVVDSKKKSKFCDNCLYERIRLQKCSSCSFAHYCNKECQRDAWNFHKIECSFLRKECASKLTNTARLIAKIILKLKNSKEYPSEEVYAGRHRSFDDLISHENEIKTDEKALERFMNVCEQIKLYLGEDSLPSNVLSIYGKVSVNTFTITDVNMNAVGLGLYLAGSIVDHSCSPNAHASFIGSQLVICSLIDWEKIDWNEVRISYIDSLNTTENRQKELKENYYFHCNCSSCSDQRKALEMQSVICGNSLCTREIAYSTDKVECPDCGHENWDNAAHDNYDTLITFTEYNLKVRNEGLSKCQEILEKQKGFLGSKNVWRVKTLDVAFEWAIQHQDFKLAQIYARENLEGLSFCLGPTHPVLGMTYLKLAKVEKYLFHIRDNLLCLEKADGILKKSHGCFTTFYKKQITSELSAARQEMQLLQMYVNNPEEKEIV